MGWYDSFSKKMFMALASGGRYQLACECENYEEWVPAEYLTDLVVTYVNPNTGEESLYRATGLSGDKHTTDYDDVPGTSIHWELICSCKEIGFTSTPTPLVSTPTPTYQQPILTPTPTSTPTLPANLCSDYDLWDSEKPVVYAGGPQYSWKDRVQWLGKVYEARDVEGVEADDQPGISNHWELVFECDECLCVPRNYNLVTTITNFAFHEAGLHNFLAFDAGDVVGLDLTQLVEIGMGDSFTLRLPNSTDDHIIQLSELSLNPNSVATIYWEHGGVCYSGVASTTNEQIGGMYIVNMYYTPTDEQICPQIPTPSPVVLPTPTPLDCSVGFDHEYMTDGLGGSHESIGGLTVEFFDNGGKIYHNSISISNQDAIMVFTSGIWKNEVSGVPFGIIVTTGTFEEGKEIFVYEDPEGTCWQGTIHPNGQNIIITEI